MQVITPKLVVHPMLGDFGDQEKTMHTSLGVEAPEVEISGKSGKVGAGGRGVRKQVEARCNA